MYLLNCTEENVPGSETDKIIYSESLKMLITQYTDI